MGAFKLGKMTFGSLFKKPETVLYPFESKPQPAGLKGHIVVDVDACILCGMCDRNCATSCITVDKKERYWEINPFACIQCGYCVTVCPKKCLHMDPNYWAAAPEQAPQRFTIPATDKGAAPKGEAQTGDAAAAETQPLQRAGSGEGAAALLTSAGDTDRHAKTLPLNTVSADRTENDPARVEDAAMKEERDTQVEALIALLDSDKAEIVKSALSGR